MQWIWKDKRWPNYNYNYEPFRAYEEKFLLNAGTILGLMDALSSLQKEEIHVQILAEEAYATSFIEGEILDRSSLISSVKKYLGIHILPNKFGQKESGIAELIVDINQNPTKKLDAALLFEWHNMMMFGNKGIQSIGYYRTHSEPMQIVSGNYSNNKIFYEAPHSNRVASLMDKFFEDFNAMLEDQFQYPNLLFAAIMHLRFEQIHPFEDGNGRIGRAIIEKILAQRLGFYSFNSLSKLINENRKQYYNALQQTNTQLNIQTYLEFFTELVLNAQEHTIETIKFVVYKSKVMNKFQSMLNLRQEKVLLRIFDEGLKGFVGGLSAANYKSITNASNATVTRDLQELMEIGILSKQGQLKSSRYYLNKDII